MCSIFSLVKKRNNLTHFQTKEFFKCNQIKNEYYVCFFTRLHIIINISWGFFIFKSEKLDLQYLLEPRIIFVIKNSGKIKRGISRDSEKLAKKEGNLTKLPSAMEID